MLGHLSRANAALLAPKLDSGAHVIAVVEEVSDKPARIRVRVTVEYDGEPAGSTIKPNATATVANRTQHQNEGSNLWGWIAFAVIILWLLTRK